ncbi:TerF vWA domain-containing protein [Streptomyces sp. DI166]|uniref:VWA domain-containing protein n=1 Tax=Streptomyces sp. DI166 TaxID=1839783 RepID=UPI0007F46E39|nr:VWA domain-containing protein [Streptomyces sp. DI166]SBT90098.1 TerF vWA domain-containing protein [Streptomyces sp. DI166]
MGILTLLRNAFGRSRKERTAEAEGATETSTPISSTPEQASAPAPAPAPTVPDPRPSTDEPDDEHELVAAAFDNVTVPKQSSPTDEPVTEPAAKADPEPAAEEPKPEPVAEQPKPVVEAAPEPAVEPEPEPEPVVEEPVAADAAPAAEPVAEPAAEAEPVAAEVAKPVAEPTLDEPAAADGEEAPQGPPAPDNESDTGGAGGNTPAEGEAEAEPQAAEPVAEPVAEPTPDEPAAADGEEAPQGPPAPDNESDTGGAGGNTPAEGEAEAEPPANEPAAGPATTLARVKTRAPGLATAYKAATTTLKKHNLTGTRAKTYLVLDRSASMRPYYKDGSAQALAEQTLALAAHLDEDPTLHVTFFSTELDGTGELTLADHENKIDELHASLGRMGRTSYHVAIEDVIAAHEKTGTPETPALVIFQTDGAPDAKTPATQALTEAAKTHPHIHFAFVAFGEHDNKAFDYLRKLKTGNTSFFHAGPTPRELTDAELYQGVLENWRP